MKRMRILLIMTLLLSVISCSKGKRAVNLSDLTVDVMLNAVQTKAVYKFDEKVYKGKWYLFHKSDDGMFVKVSQGDVTAEPISLKNLSGEYRMVFLACPLEQAGKVHFPDELSVIESDYSLIYAVYQAAGGSEDAENEIFRDIISFTTTEPKLNHTALLTRQNGALEVRIKNMDLTKVELYVNGTKNMFLYDGDAGRVISSEPVMLYRMMEGEAVNSTDVRIRINLLPQENVSADAISNDPDVDTKDNRLVIYTQEAPEGISYPIKSDRRMIPIYPNQVTWLTLGAGTDGNFVVGFGDINLDDDDWDGWN